MMKSFQLEPLMLAKRYLRQWSSAYIPNVLFPTSKMIHAVYISVSLKFRILKQFFKASLL